MPPTVKDIDVDDDLRTSYGVTPFICCSGHLGLGDKFTIIKGVRKRPKTVLIMLESNQTYHKVLVSQLFAAR